MKKGFDKVISFTPVSTAERLPPKELEFFYAFEKDSGAWVLMRQYLDDVIIYADGDWTTKNLAAFYSHWAVISPPI